MTNRSLLTVLLAGACLASGGCFWRGRPTPAEGTSIRTVGPFRVVLAVPAGAYEPGDSFTVTVTTTNVSDEPVVVHRWGSVAYYLTVSHNRGTGWEEVHTYPGGTAGVMESWTFRPGQQKSTAIRLTVEPDWPVGELLRLEAHMNGREEVRAAEFVEIIPRTP